MTEQVREIAISELHSFKGHPFHVTNDAAMAALCESVQAYLTLFYRQSYKISVAFLSHRSFSSLDRFSHSIFCASR